MTRPISRTDRSPVKEWRRSLDWALFIAAIFLLAVGLLLSLAAGPSAAARIGYEDPFFFVYRHMVFAGGALVVFTIVSLLDKVWIRRVAGVLFVVAFAMMAFILLFGHEAKGAQRWLRLGGYSFQPSEVIKPALIVLIGWLLAQRELYPRGPWAALAFSFFGATAVLLLLQPDVGQTVLLAAAFGATFFVAGLPWKWGVAFMVGSVTLGVFLYSTLGYVRYRVDSFLNPNIESYQIDTAERAIRHGGILGVGPGEGQVKDSLPDAHTDFIFSVMMEEFGLFAAIIVICIFAFITLRGLKAASRLSDPYPRAAAAGLFTLFGLQAVINIAVNVALIPPKGMTLPFVSYGGSSMLGTALTLGFALALVKGYGPQFRRSYGRGG